jgi:DNA (cytosine-5)-methyltransferase 1
MAADSHRHQDLARAHRRGSGGQDLITAVIRAELDDSWAVYRQAILRWESQTRVAPAPTQLNRKGRPRVNVAFFEWMMGWGDGWVTDVGIPRADQLWIIGNGVCPQQAVTVLRALGLGESQVEVEDDSQVEVQA